MTVLDEVKHMYDQKLFSNVSYLSSLLLSVADHNSEFLAPLSKLQLLVWYADSVYEQHEYRRAESIYQKALQLKKSLLKTKGKTAALQNDILSDLDIKYSIYLCHLNLRQFPQAITMLESVPARQRNVKINMALAKLYHQAGMERSAITLYNQVLKECPLALDAAMGLLALGVKGAEVAALALTGATGSPNMEWLSMWIRAHASLYLREFPNAVTAFTQLDTRTIMQDNGDILSSLGEAHYLSGDYKQSFAVLKRAHQADPFLLRGMDILSTLYTREKQFSELEKLSTKLMAITDQASEPWVAVGNYVLATRAASRAGYYAQKACNLNNRNVEACILKGRVLQELKKPAEAIVAFRESLKIMSFRFESHQGLVKSYTSLHRPREALAIASNACKQLGQTPRTLSLIASALAVESASVDKAEAYLEKALKLDPNNLDIVYQMAELYNQEQRYDKGIELLKKQTAVQSTSHLHRLLADFYTNTNDNDKAMEHFSAALNLDCNNSHAIEGLQRAEQHLDMRGATYNCDVESMPDSENEAEAGDSEAEEVWSDDDFPL